MGERAGYMCRDGKCVSPMLRKQWYIGEDKASIRNFVMKTAKVLMNASDIYFGGEETIIGGGNVALRSDLGISRMFPAIVYAMYKPPYDEIFADVASDISDHGIFEIELLEWNKWQVNNYPVDSEWMDENGKKHTSEEVINSLDMRFNKLVWHENVKEEEAMAMAVIEFEEGKTLKDGVKFDWILENMLVV